ncbi:MAG: type II toxin-antitoxin system VapC family toxin [Rhodospirillaceae bacterium]|nr:type II toxin-antitoxin system VapC family toxin [Rhodospirillaceae bacterium]
MKLLIDTHALLWWAFNDVDRLSTTALRALADRANDVLVSSASAWEIATKFRIGKLPEARAFIEDFAGVVARAGAEHLPTLWTHALAAGLLPGPHRDPFDRLLAAQAKIENARVVSADPVFAHYGVPVIW